MYQTPASISYLAQFILAVSIAAYLLWQRARTGHRDPRSAWLTVFLLAVAGLILCLGGNVSLAPGPNFYPLTPVALCQSVALVALIQFAYRLPALVPRWQREARLVLGLTLIDAAGELAFAVYRLVRLVQGHLVFSFDWTVGPLILMALWGLFVLLRQVVATSAGPPRPWPRVLLRPRGDAARVTRHFVILFLIIAVVGLNDLVSWVLFSEQIRNAVLSVGVLAALFASAWLYISYFPDLTSLLVKLIGVCLFASLALFGGSAWFLEPIYLRLYPQGGPIADRQTLHFAPNAQGGYDVTAAPERFVPDLGSRLEVGNGPSIPVELPFAFPFYGHTWRELYVADDGLVNFGRPAVPIDARYDYGMQPAIMALYTDLVAGGSGAGGVYAAPSANRLLVTWHGLRERFGRRELMTVQLALYADGAFDITYHGIPPFDLESIYQAGHTSYSQWMMGALPGTPSITPGRLDLAASLPYQGTAQGVVYDPYLALRQHLHPLVAPLALMLLGSSLLILVGIPLFLRVGLVVPLNALLAGVRQVNGGRLDVTIPVRYRDEVGFVTAAFNTMAARLRDLVRGLEARVAARTAELAARTEELHLANAQMAGQLGEIQARNEELDAFARTVAHDIKNPLSLIASYASFLTASGQEIAPSELTEFLHVIDQNATDLARVVDALLLLARVRQEEVPREPVDMGLLLTHVLARLSDQVEASQAEIVLPPVTAWPLAWGYGPWIEEIWVNYVGNAVKYGGAPPLIELGYTPLTNQPASQPAIQFWVRDHGPGISAEDQARLFTPFTQLDHGPGGSHGLSRGHGLGLSIVRRITDRLGGQAGVDSAPGRGSLFYFTLAAVSEPVGTVAELPG